MVITLFRPWEKKYSSIGWRTRLLLEEKKIKYETRLVVLQMQENQSEEILKLNPRGRVILFLFLKSKVTNFTRF
jgi:hypothetical protein